MAIRRILSLAALATASAIGTPSFGAAIYLDFENIAPYPNNNNVLIQNYYNGGTSSIGTSGTNYGVSFTSGATLLCLNTAADPGCSNTSRGGQGIATSQLGALYFPEVNPTMNVAAGFTDGFSFVYSDPFAVGTTVSIYSGINGSGTLLASSILPGTPNNGCDNSISGGANYCPFVAASVGFAGTAQSVVFGGSINRQVFDDFTFGSVVVGGGTSTAVPEPSVWAMMIVGIGLVGASLRRRKPLGVMAAA